MRSYPNNGKTKAIDNNDHFNLAYWQEGECNYIAWIDINGNMYKLGDWKNDVVHLITLSEVCKLTGDTENMVLARWRDFFGITE